MAQLFVLPKALNIDSNLKLVEGAIAKFYKTGTTTPQTVYQDAALSTPWGTSVTADSAGVLPPIYLDDSLPPYKLDLQASDGISLPGYPVDPVNAVILTAAAIGAALYPKTSAESNASVAPTIYVPSLQIDLERYGGGVGASTTTNYAAWQSAMAVIVKKGGGILVMRGGLSGDKYNFGANTLSAAQGLILQGDGYNTILKFATTGSNAGLLIPSTVGRVELRDLVLSGPGDGLTGSGNAGRGLQIGDSSGNSGLVLARKVNLNGWDTGMLMSGLIWGRFEQCEFGPAVGTSAGNISNNVGMDFNFLHAGNQVNAVTFQDCIVSNNANSGVKATNVSAAMNVINWYATSVQNNCQSTTSNPQFQTGSMQGFSIKGLYMEYVFGGTLPDAIDSTLWNYGSLRDFYITQCAQGIRDRSGSSMGQVHISDGTILSNTGNPINCASEIDLKIENVFTNVGTVIATNANGSKAFLSTGYGVGAWKQDEVDFTPAIAFGTSGSITQSVQAAKYSQIGNVVTVSFRINWSAISSPTGSVTVTGLPVAPKAGGPDVAFYVWSSGLTISAGSLSLEVANGSTTGSLYNVQTTTAAVQGAAFASSGSIIVSGSYQV